MKRNQKLLLVIGLFLFFGCSVDNERLSEWGSNHESSKLVSFIDNNIRYPHQEDLVLHAINEILRNDLSEAKQAIEQMVFGEKKYDDDLIKKVLKIYIDNQQYISLDNLLDLFLLNEDKAIDSLLIIMSNKSPQISIDSCRKHMVANCNNYSGLSRISEKMLKLNCSTSLQDISISLNNSSQDYIDLLHKKHILLTSMSSLEDSISYIQKRIEESEENIEKIPSIFGISAYIVSRYDDDKYEISDDYNNHAILYTTETTFQSKGWFSMWVIKTGERQVELKQEYGGFIQNWPVYLEITESGRTKYLNKLSDTKKNLKIDKQILEKIKKQRIKAENKLNNINRPLQARKSKIVDLLCKFGLGIVTDNDGNKYNTVKIGDQWWMVENLKVTHYRNGDPIRKVKDDDTWSELTTEAYCNYDNFDGNVDIYGSIYNWYAVTDIRNIAPADWHVPTDDEWKQLEMYLGMSQSEADKSSSYRGTDQGSQLAGNADLWYNGGLVSNAAFGSSGFAMLPGGYRSSSGLFYYMGDYASFWSATEAISNTAWSRELGYGHSDFSRYFSYKHGGFSVRCVRD